MFVDNAFAYEKNKMYFAITTGCKETWTSSRTGKIYGYRNVILSKVQMTMGSNESVPDYTYYLRGNKVKWSIYGWKLRIDTIFN